ncbi:MAG: hypothetical protein WCD69_26915, partial [Xanthobacteraceae bacterium]
SECATTVTIAIPVVNAKARAKITAIFFMIPLHQGQLCQKRQGASVTEVTIWTVFNSWVREREGDRGGGTSLAYSLQRPKLCYEVPRRLWQPLTIRW